MSIKEDEKKSAAVSRKIPAIDAAFSYLSNGNKSSMETGKYLENKNYNSSEITDVIEQLVNMGCIDDKKYSYRFLELSLDKGHGLNRIRQELQYEKGIATDVVDAAIRDYESENACDIIANEAERAMVQALKLLDGSVPDTKLLNKISRKLSYLGFSTETVMEVVRKCREIN